MEIRQLSNIRDCCCVAVCLQVTPSVYTREMLQSTEERLANTTEVHPPRILELLDMSKTTQHKVNSKQCWETHSGLKLLTIFDFEQNNSTARWEVFQSAMMTRIMKPVKHVSALREVKTHILEAAPIIRDTCDSDKSLQRKIRSRAAITIADYKQVSVGHVYANKTLGSPFWCLCQKKNKKKHWCQHLIWQAVVSLHRTCRLLGYMIKHRKLLLHFF